MKKILLGLLLTAGVSGLKAQQLMPVNPSDSLLQKLLIKPAPSPPFKPLDKVNLNKVVITAAPYNIDHMPVAVLQGNSKMPVIKPGGNYTMPVAGKSPVAPFTSPALKTP